MIHTMNSCEYIHVLLKESDFMVIRFDLLLQKKKKMKFLPIVATTPGGVFYQALCPGHTRLLTFPFMLFSLLEYISQFVTLKYLVILQDQN